MYEWDSPVDQNRIECRCIDLRKEISRITNVTLRGDFKNPADRTYWEDRAKKLSGELSALEAMGK
ncbi:hypothetical protein [Alcaligenes faecalis]|uniref:hypothetical protein n=1 Tax=Alcaligenes faecalis TaxID=511 RepID=UPI0018EF27CC|nr:hypothetical protein [Alcaligenes faecalis]